MWNYPFTLHVRLNAGCKIGCQHLGKFLWRQGIPKGNRFTNCGCRNVPKLSEEGYRLPCCKLSFVLQCNHWTTNAKQIQSIKLNLLLEDEVSNGERSWRGSGRPSSGSGMLPSSLGCRGKPYLDSQGSKARKEPCRRVGRNTISWSKLDKNYEDTGLIRTRNEDEGVVPKG